MEQFSVKISGLDNCANQQSAIINSLDRISGDIMDVRSTLGFNIGTNLAIKTNLLALAGAVELNEIRVKKMRSTINDVKNTYVKTENRLASNMTPLGIAVNEIIDFLTNPGMGFSYSAVFPGNINVGFVAEFLGDRNFDWKLGSGTGMKFSPALGWEMDGDGNWTAKNVFKMSDEEFKKEFEKQMLDNTKIISEEVSVDRSVFSADGSISGEYGSGSVSMDLLKAQAKASAYVGTGGAALGVGASVTLLELQAQGQLGNDMLGVHGSAGVEVGKVAAEAELKATWMNEDGEIDPNLSLNLSAEAIAAEAKAQVGVDVLGTDINGSVGVNFGVGAHADIGFEDGKLKCDVGASLGLGVSVDLEIDVSGTIDAVVEHAEDIKNAAVDVMDTATDFAGDVIDGVGDALSDAGDAISDFGGWVKGLF